MRVKNVLERAREEGVALTFNDVRLKTGYSEVMPDDVSLETKFSRNVGLKVPILSAAMDTVTEHKLATELAKLGGMGVIHRAFSPEDQALQVARVKSHLNGRIKRPIWVKENQTVEEALKCKRDKGYHFNSFPVKGGDGKLIGLVSGNDFDFCGDLSVLIGSIMTPLSRLETAPSDTNINNAYVIMREKKKKILPLIDEDGKLDGMYVFSDLKRIISGSAESYNVDKNGQLCVAAAVGTGDDTLDRVGRLIEENVDVIVIDTAHGDSKNVYEILKKIKKQYNVDVVVGNVSSGESAKKLVDAGADGIKVGQGPGSICTTRVVAGIGSPQVSAVYDCARAIEDSKIPICADGGLENSGDIPIAIASGAHSVMLGSMLAGTDEAPGEVIFVDGRQWKDYRGMGSLGAMEDHESSRDRYSQSDVKKDKLVPEGVEGRIPYNGKLSKMVFQYVSGLRKGMGYTGSASIEELIEKGDFIRITSAGLSESHPHGVVVTKDSPNYDRGRK